MSKRHPGTSRGSRDANQVYHLSWNLSEMIACQKSMPDRTRADSRKSNTFAMGWNWLGFAATEQRLFSSPASRATLASPELAVSLFCDASPASVHTTLC
jgi:hypothetical protein